MPNAYNPKLRFQADTQRRERWAQMASDPVFHDAMIHAQSHLAQAGFNPQEMVGVTHFIHTLVNLSEDVMQNTALPVKKLADTETPKK
jgi:hypothetical protein